MLTSSKVDDDVNEEDGVRETVERDPSSAQIVVEEGNCNRQNDQVRNQKQKHTKVPIKPENECDN